MDLDDLRARFAGRLLTDPADTMPFLVDWRGTCRGAALAVVQPDTTKDVAAVVGWCAQHRVPIVPQGGNTGLVGGAIPDASGDAMLLSLARLDRIRDVNPADDTIVAEAGCTLSAVQAAAAAADRLFPLSLAAEGSCTIGGNIATNAGGTAVLRYGSMRQLCLGLEVVTASGAVWDGMRALHKDNSGYALRDLFVGSEGTLGIVTAAVLRLFPRPAARSTAFVALGEPAQALSLLAMARTALDARLTGFELQTGSALELVLRHVPATRRPLPPAPWYVLIEASDDGGVAAALEALLVRAIESGVASDVVVAASEAQAAALWSLRESIGAAQTAEGAVLKHDISVPVSSIASFLLAADRALARWRGDLLPVTFGHVGDGNLHYNFSLAPGGDAVRFAAAGNEVARLIDELVTAFGGSIAAEHGVGILRRDDAARHRSSVATEMMARIKVALDPMNLLNPGKVVN